MASRPVSLLVPILGLTLAFVSPIQSPEMAKTRRSRSGAAAAATSPYGAWGNQAALNKHMTLAKEWARESLKKGATGPAFVIEPTAIVSDPIIVAEVIREDWAAGLKILGAKDGAAADKLSLDIAGHVLAVYAPKTGVIHVLPANAQRAAEAAGNPKLRSEDALRLLLVRMSIIALTRQHTEEWKSAIDAAESIDALQAAAAVFQGRAQFQTRRVAGYWNEKTGFSLGAYDDLVGLLTAPAHSDASKGLKAFAAAANFALIKGENFMGNVPRSRHEAILKAPPTKLSVIFDPKAFVAELRGGNKGPKALGETILKEFTTTVMNEGEWATVAADVTADDLKAMLQPLQSMMYSMAIGAFQNGKSWTATAAGEGGEVNKIYLMEFRKAGPAESFVSLVRGAAKQRGATCADGAGRDDNLPGFHGSEALKAGEPEVTTTWHSQWTSEGRFVVGFSTNRDLSQVENRDDYDDAMEAAAEAVAKVVKTRDSRRKRRGR